MIQTITMANALNFLATHQPQLWSVGLVLFGALVARLSRLRPILIYSVGHAANLLLDHSASDDSGTSAPQRGLIRTASITLQNEGLSPAKNAEITFNWKPEVLNVTPARSFAEITNQFDRFTLRFDSVSPKEQITIDIMSFNRELPSMTSIRSDDCVGKPRLFQLQRVWPTWFNMGVLIVFMCGLYLIARGAVWLIGL